MFDVSEFYNKTPLKYSKGKTVSRYSNFGDSDEKTIYFQSTKKSNLKFKINFKVGEESTTGTIVYMDSNEDKYFILNPTMSLLVIGNVPIAIYMKKNVLYIITSNNYEIFE
jgi:hypothetical protein